MFRSVFYRRILCLCCVRGDWRVIERISENDIAGKNTNENRKLRDREGSRLFLWL